MKKNPKPYGLSLRNSNIFHKVLYYIGFLIVIQSCAVEDGDSDYTDPRDKFIGTWNVIDQPARINYVVSIVKDPAQSTQVLLNNFADMGGSANGLVVGGKIIIDNQNIGDGFLSNGTGTYLSSSQLEFEFILDDGIEVEARKATYAK